MRCSRQILRLTLAGTLFGISPWASAEEATAATGTTRPTSSPARTDDKDKSRATERLDAEAFRRGLRERGLFELLDLYDREYPPGDEIGRALRQREALLRACDDARRSTGDRRESCRLASEILEKLLAANPAHPDRFVWRAELGRDLVERQSAPAIEALLFRVASSRQRDEIGATADRAIRTLQQLAADLAAEWQRIGTLPPEQFEQLSAANRPKELESIEAAGAYLLAWAKLYRAMVLPASDPRRADLLSQVSEEVVTRRGWTAQPHEKTGLQVQSLVLAAIAQRLAGKLDLADTASQQAVTIYSQTTDPQRRRKLDTWALLAVLERIRLLRDRGEPAEALAAVGRAYEWAAKTRPDDIGAVVALAVLERSLASAAGQPVANDRLLPLARTNAMARPLIYESLGCLFREQGDLRTAGPLEKLGLVWVLAEDAAGLPEGAKIARLLSDTKDDAFVASEALSLLARCEAARSQPTAAAEALIRLAREYPSSDRAATAADEAVRLAAQGAAATGSSSVAATRTTTGRRPSTAPTTTRATTRARRDAEDVDPLFVEARETLVQAVRLLRERSPNNPRLPDAMFVAGVALQQLERWQDAAAEFASIPLSHDLATEAALRRARCLVRQYETRPDEPGATQALLAVTDAQRRIESLPEPKRNPCWTAETILLRAGIQAGPTVKQPEAALTTLVDFDTRYGTCEELIGAMWRVRLTAMESLDQLQQANTIVDRMLAAEPDRVGPAMVDLLSRMQEKIERLRNEGDADGVRKLAGEAAKLAEKIERWASERSAPGAAGTASVARLARAKALLDADRADEACRLADGQPAKDINWQFVRAECSYRAKSYREALPVFHQIWQSSEEASPLWWRALLRNLQCHTEIGTDPDEILQSIRQHQHHHNEMGGRALQKEFEILQKRNEQRKSGR